MRRPQAEPEDGEVLRTLGTALRTLRGQRSIEAVAERLHLSSSWLSRIEGGQVDVPATLLRRIARYYHVPVCELLRLEGEPAHPVEPPPAGILSADPVSTLHYLEGRADLRELVGALLEVERRTGISLAPEIVRFVHGIGDILPRRD